jgi:hypothetical protein
MPSAHEIGAGVLERAASVLASGPATAGDVAAACGWTYPMAAAVLLGLRRRGWLSRAGYEPAQSSRPGGRRRAIWRLDADPMIETGDCDGGLRIRPVDSDENADDCYRIEEDCP